MQAKRARHAAHGGRWALFERSRADRWVAGVAGGLGERLDIDPVVIRLAFVVLAGAGGFGLFLYVLLWLVSAEPRPAPTRTEANVRVTGSVQKTVAAGLVVLGMLLLLRAAGLWFGDALVWPVALAAFGSAVMWTRSDEAGRARWGRLFAGISRTRGDRDDVQRVSIGRLLLGGVLIAAGMAAFFATNHAASSSTALGAIRNVAVAVVVTLSGLALILGPWVARLAREAAEERRERIRIQEREEVAAHLHDSVLQTLALMQRTSDPAEMSALARRQERELRTWLYRTTDADPSGLLSTAIDRVAERVELAHHIRVETVVVGDCPVDQNLQAVVDACGEAATNAAKHSGADEVSIYVEVEPDAITAFVRDKGKGFDPETVPQDRRGIADSIRGRMQRYGGTATIVSEPGAGTEVQLRVPREDG
jgi:signal transduction histidine kinase